MRAGKLRHRLVIQKKSSGSPTRTSTGASGLTWATLLTVYGSLEPLSGERLETAQATWPKATVEARVRYRSEILDADTSGTSMRISFGGRFYPIGKVLNMEERNKELHLLCTQGSASG
jgi:SPP1 family predicted phage head-tail adaptor